MGVNWKNVIKNQARGMDAVSAFYKEQERVRQENRAEYEKRVREAEERRRKEQEGK